MLRLSLVLLAAMVSTPLSAKSLYWRSVDVEARLDAGGTMHTVERQTFVFTGDWNGGERIFEIREDQSLDNVSVSRVVDGKEVPLGRGDLTNVDEWAFFSGTPTARWRSRLPTDPEFDNTEITYVLRYSVSNVLRISEGRYRLAHDFAFPQRSGMIQNFSLRFVLDDAWKGLRSPHTMTMKNLMPGESAIVHAELEYAGAGSAPAATRLMNRSTAYGIAGLFVAGLLFLIARFAIDEGSVGRFARLLSPDSIDESWLNQNVLDVPPEVAGAAIDDKVGAPSVAAVLARMEREGKISTRVEKSKILRRNVLHLKLEANRDSLPGYELALVKKLFFNNRDETNTDAIRKKYNGTGFSPAATIESGIKSQLARLPEWNKEPKVVEWKRLVTIGIVSFVLVIAAAFLGGNNSGIAVAILFFGMLPLIPALVFAAFAQTSLSPVRVFVPLLLMGGHIWFVYGYTTSAPEMVVHPFTLIAISLFVLSCIAAVLGLMRIRQTAAKIAARKRFAAARRWFARELRSPEPRLRDDWFPYVIAFGLGKNAERWFARFGSAAEATARSSASGSFSSSSSSGVSTSSWTGGGGAFGGAGATGGWALAAGALAAGVSAPSSSSGSSGGSSSSSGGSSSGGGGGGGW